MDITCKKTHSYGRNKDLANGNINRIACWYFWKALHLTFYTYSSIIGYYSALPLRISPFSMGLICVKLRRDPYSQNDNMCATMHARNLQWNDKVRLACKYVVTYYISLLNNKLKRGLWHNRRSIYSQKRNTNKRNASISTCEKKTSAISAAVLLNVNSLLCHFLPAPHIPFPSSSIGIASRITSSWSLIPALKEWPVAARKELDDFFGPIRC